MENELNKNVMNDLPVAAGNCIKEIYSKYPHECKIVMYVGTAIMLLVEAYNEYSKYQDSK